MIDHLCDLKFHGKLDMCVRPVTTFLMCIGDMSINRAFKLCCAFCFFKDNRVFDRLRS